MKKILSIMMISLVLIMYGCSEISLDYLKIKLNPGVDTIEINEEFIDTGAVASYGLKQLEVVVISNNVDTTKLGVYEIIYQTTHRDLVQTIVRIVTVVDQTPPYVVLNPGIDTIKVSETWEDASVISTDNSLGLITITVEGEVLQEEGVYAMIYRVKDASGNETKVTRFVHVIS